MAGKDSIHRILLAMEETARATAAGDSSKQNVTPAFVQQLNSLVAQVNELVPEADLALFEEGLQVWNTGFPSALEVLQQIKLALDFLVKSPTNSPKASALSPNVAEPEIERPGVFIGCSVEGLRVAKIIQMTLSHRTRPVIWHQGVFGLSHECGSFS
ncbi:MAG: hypothetical protein GY769_02555 [bacterium]|nr:hypothetical protein [bacterium]